MCMDVIGHVNYLHSISKTMLTKKLHSMLIETPANYMGSISEIFKFMGDFSKRASP